jgi:predicted DNA-binding transcriptional regulator YafY
MATRQRNLFALLKLFVVSKNKNQLARFRRIHELLSLRKGVVVKPDEFCRACAISRRTLDNDLAFMREEYEAPIIWDKRLQGYCYERPFDLTAQIALNMDDVHRLHVAVETLAQFEHLEVFRELRGTVDKIRKGVSGWVRSTPAAKSIFFEPVQYAGTEYLPVLLQAIEERRQVTFSYHSFHQEAPRTCSLEPYCIRQYDQRWYAVGHSPEYTYLKPFALDRIVSKPELTKVIFDPPHFNPEQFFQHIYGMHTESEEQAQKVVLQFSPLQARYFLSKPFHPYQLITEQEDGSIEVELSVCTTIELIRKIASYGEEVEVLAPTELRRTMCDFFEAGRKKYAVLIS